MSALTFFYPVLDALSSGKVIRKAVTLALQVLGILTVLGGLYALVNILRVSFQAPTTDFTLGGLVLALIFLAAVACVAEIFFYRAGKVKELVDSPFTVIPIVSILFRAVGEIYATLCVAIGVGGCLFVWLAKANPLSLLGGLGEFMPTVLAQETFVGGLLFMVYLCLVGFVMLVVFYFLAESTLLLPDIAMNIRLLRGAVAPAAAAAPTPQAAPMPQPAPTPQAAPMPQAAPVPPPVRPAIPRCPSCSAPLDPGSVFCGNCGARVA
jgi:hypothetical protein